MGRARYGTIGSGLAAYAEIYEQRRVLSGDGADEAELSCFRNRLYARPRTQLLDNILDVETRGARTAMQFLRNLLVGKTSPSQSYAFDLATRQIVYRLGHSGNNRPVVA